MLLEHRHRLWRFFRLINVPQNGCYLNKERHISKKIKRIKKQFFVTWIGMAKNIWVTHGLRDLVNTSNKTCCKI